MSCLGGSKTYESVVPYKIKHLLKLQLLNKDRFKTMSHS